VQCKKLKSPAPDIIAASEPSSFVLVRAALFAAPRVVRDADAQAAQTTQMILATQVAQVRRRPAKAQALALLVSSTH